jgi:ribosomal protein S18 acetylase RimI-like enzyme
MTPTLSYEILDLRHFAARDLRGILDEESRVWSERLHWDYRSSARLLLEYLDSRVLPGYVALEGGRVSGYIFCVYEGSKAVIGDVFASSPGAPGVEVEESLIRHLVELLRHSPQVDRIESQLLLHPSGAHAASFAGAGFTLYRRLFMERPLEAPASAPAPVLPEGLEMRSWRDTDFALAGRLITAAYQGHIDSRINDQYRSAEGSLRFLHNIVRFPGCGIFEPEVSRLLCERGRSEPVGLMLCSRVREDVGHVTQICLHPGYRRRGLGRLLLASASESLARRGFRALSLTVTEKNAEAVFLYDSMGFETIHTFDAMVWER